MLKYNSLFHSHNTAWKVPKYAVFSGPYFPVVGLNTEIYSVFSSNKGKQGPEKTLYLDTFHAKQFMIISNQFYYLYRANENLEIAYLFDLSNWPSQSNFEAFTLDNFLVNGHYL